MTFQFRRGNVIGVRGPAVSLDERDSWTWLGSAAANDTSFRYTFPPDADEAQFSFAMPYKILEAVQRGPLAFRLSDSQEFTTWGGGDRVGPIPGAPATWVRMLPGVQVGSVLEMPYASAAADEVNQDSARAFGHDLARALHVYLNEGTE